MSLNNISLPPQLVADLYHHSLVGGNTSAVPQTPPVPFLGKGGKNILIVVNQPSVPYLPDAELAFLTKVLTACQLGLVDIAIVNWSKAPHHDVPAMLQQFGAKAVILFDVAPVEFGLLDTAPPFTMQQHDGAQFVAAPALSQIEETREARQQLWLALKELFGL